MSINEGRLFKRIELLGKVFEIYYGYYEEKDRKGQYNESIPIYPDFKKNPVYTDDSFAFVTAMQDKCEHFKGNPKGDSCISCSYFQFGCDLIGICQNKNNKENLQ